MAGPISLNDPLHLDGILLAAREKCFGIESRGQPFDVIARRDGVYQASAGMIVSEGRGGIVEFNNARVRRLDMKGRDGRNMEFKPGTSKNERTVGPMSPYRNTLSSEKIMGNIRLIIWQALADAEATTKLLEMISFLGKQHVTGWGEVEEFEVLGSNAKPETCGLSSGDRPLRNLPVDLARFLGVNCDSVFKGRIEPSYATKEGRVDIAGPVLADMITSEDAARELLSY
jgi:hypothetical protein